MRFLPVFFSVSRIFWQRSASMVMGFSVITSYGIPMDSRGDYTKTDWEMWSTRLFDDAEYTNMIVDAIWDFLCETPDRTPFTDLHFTSKPWERGFQARTVQGGLFINLLNF